MEQRLYTLLEQSRAAADQALAEGLERPILQLEAWQKQRLDHWYRDFTAQPRYRAATRFFIDELYAPRDLAQRDRDLSRMAPTMVHLLPDSTLKTVCQALEVQVLSLQLDMDLARQLGRLGIDPSRMDHDQYAHGYRECGNRDQRVHQLELILSVGHALDVIVHRPMIYSALKMARWPARLAGLAELQRFLEAGFSAFRAMDSADEFLAAIEMRESAVLNGIFDGPDNPLRGGVPGIPTAVQ
ncbi:MAG: hypothetical protein QNJ40_25285 [Xanthomonadales bacterium]|nr:hypothetical protein [Xanthomonadales bacterium]